MELPTVPTAVVLTIPCVLLPSGDIIKGEAIFTVGTFATLGPYLTVKPASWLP